MEVVILLLVCAVSPVVVPAPVSVQTPHDNLKHIIDLVSDFNSSFTKEYYVEDVEDLYHAGCETHFFCKVHDVLKHHNKAAEENLKKDISRIVRNLEVYNNHLKSNCTLILKTVRKSEVSRPITTLLDFVSKCSKRINFSGPFNTTSSP